VAVKRATNPVSAPLSKSGTLAAPVLPVITPMAPVTRQLATKPNVSEHPVEPPQHVATAPAVRQPPLPTQPTVYGAIEGASWLDRENGGSDLVRGLNVFLLSTVCPKVVFVQCLKATADDLDAEAKRWRADAAKQSEDAKGWAAKAADARSANLSTVADFDEKQAAWAKHEAAFQEEMAKRCEDRSSGLRTQADQARDQIDTMEAVETLKGRSYVFPAVTKLSDIAVARARTDVDAKYTFAKLPAGNYVIYAQVAGETVAGVTFVFGWFVPVTVRERETTHVDLDNENACIRESHKAD